MENVIGVIGAKGGVGTSSLIVNLGILLAEKGFKTCILDADVIKPSIFFMLSDDFSKFTKGFGLLNLLRYETAELNSNIIKTKTENLYLITRSLVDPIEDFMDIRDEAYMILVKRLKDVFDVVLIDIPFVPFLESCYSFANYCDRGYFVWEENLLCVRYTSELKIFLKNIAIESSKFDGIIVNKSTNLKFNYESINVLKSRLIAVVPYIKDFTNYINQGQPFIIFGNHIPGNYVASLETICRDILGASYVPPKRKK